jgi:hypothetical protein
MACLNSIRKRLNCKLTKTEDEPFNPNAYICRRRMGISSSGTVVEMDNYGEPINPNDVYNDLEIHVYMKKSKSINDEESVVGGINHFGKTKQLELIVSLTADIVKNDLVEFPLNSNDWYRVNEIDNVKNIYSVILCVSEARSEI